MTSTLLPAGCGGIATPERSLEQRLDALRQANEIRVRRSRLKRDIRTGECAPSAVIESPPPCAASMRIFDLLCAIPKCGRVKAARLLNQHRVGQSKTLCGLSDRQRGELAAAVKARWS